MQCNASKLSTLKHNSLKFRFPFIRHMLIVTSSFLLPIIRAITQDIELVEQSFQVLAT